MKSPAPPYSFVSLYAIVLFMAWAILAFGTRSLAPWFFWFTMAALPAAAIYRESVEWFRSPTAKKVYVICAGLFLLHMGWALVRSQYYDASASETYWRDDHHYFVQAEAIAQAWSEGYYPELHLKGSLPYLGTLHTGYHRPLAVMFLIAGGSTLAGLIVNALCLSLLPLLCALCAKWLFGRDKHSDSLPRSRFRTLTLNSALCAAVLTALHPAQFYWSAYLMKDAWTAFVFMATLATIVGSVRKRSLVLAIAAIVLLAFLFSVRVYAGASLVMGLALLPALKLRRAHFTQLLVFGLLAGILLFRYTELGSGLASQVQSSLAALGPKDVQSPVDVLKQLFAGIPRLFLAPYGWIILPEPSPQYGMYPGMWYLYLLIYPLGFAGLYASIKKDIGVVIIPLTAFGVAALVFLVSEFGGNASRQRYYLEYIFILFAAYGLKYPSRGWILGIYILIAAWAIGQVIALNV